MKWCVLALLLLCAPPSAAETTIHTIQNDRGGELLGFIAKYTRWRDDGDRVRVVGQCDSACTIVLGVVDPDNICAVPGAKFGFHSASLILSVKPVKLEYSAEATQVLWWFYSARTRQVLAQHGWPKPSNHPEIVAIDAREIVQPCMN